MLIFLNFVVIELKVKFLYSGLYLLIRFGIPHFDQTPDHLKPFIAYALWGVDKKGNCLTHRRADHFETVEKINEKYGSETAIAAAQRHRE